MFVLQEYTLMWTTRNGIEVVGFFLNCFMASTWIIAGNLSKQSFQVKYCVFAGLLYGLIATFPSLVLKYELPCECETEEWWDYRFFTHTLSCQ